MTLKTIEELKRSVKNYIFFIGLLFVFFSLFYMTSIFTSLGVGGQAFVQNNPYIFINSFIGIIGFGVLGYLAFGYINTIINKKKLTYLQSISKSLKYFEGEQ